MIIYRFYHILPLFLAKDKKKERKNEQNNDIFSSTPSRPSTNGLAVSG